MLGLIDIPLTKLGRFSVYKFKKIMLQSFFVSPDLVNVTFNTFTRSSTVLIQR